MPLFQVGGRAVEVAIEYGTLGTGLHVLLLETGDLTIDRGGFSRTRRSTEWAALTENVNDSMQHRGFVRRGAPAVPPVPTERRWICDELESRRRRTKPEMVIFVVV